mmetsp:Transcript_58338/g.187394  ORF Transcript_58338/g.187394 Transcript_58338/m.187394 type:complete len:218 (-) Transcript_58338:353-1006(-)
MGREPAAPRRPQPAARHGHALPRVPGRGARLRRAVPERRLGPPRELPPLLQPHAPLLLAPGREAEGRHQPRQGGLRHPRGGGPLPLRPEPPQRGLHGRAPPPGLRGLHRGAALPGPGLPAARLLPQGLLRGRLRVQQEDPAGRRQLPAGERGRGVHERRAGVRGPVWHRHGLPLPRGAALPALRGHDARDHPGHRGHEPAAPALRPLLHTVRAGLGR